MDSRQRVQGRIAAATQRDVLLGIFIESTLDHMITTLGAERAEAVRLKVIKKVISFFRYPVADLLKLLDGAIPEKATDEQFDAAVRDFGRAAVRFFFASPVGKTMAILAGDSPHRLLSSAPSGFKAVTTFGERSYTKTGEQSAEFTFNGDLMGPAWEVGVISEALSQLCKLEAQITVKPLNDLATDFVLSVRW